jgi:hypothetical protein
MECASGGNSHDYLKSNFKNIKWITKLILWMGNYFCRINWTH